jgi:glucose-1-phosphate cytidylyltransferase
MMEVGVKVVILCGGRGIRSFPFTNYLPKPMLPLRGTPIIVHVIKSFIAQGFDDFVLAAGYRKSVLDDYFEGKDLGARIQVLDTGEDTNTGGRIFACREVLGERFIVTYADGLCDVPLRRLVAFHDKHEGAVTITSVLMTSQYGVLSVNDDGQVARMREKPIIDEHWINAGFIVFNSSVFAHWHGEDLEREVLPHLINLGLVYSYRHDGFFKSADNYKDIMEFEEMMSDGRRPWDVKDRAQ